MGSTPRFNYCMSVNPNSHFCVIQGHVLGTICHNTKCGNEVIIIVLEVPGTYCINFKLILF
jgi:hypothetical protein